MHVPLGLRAPNRGLSNKRGIPALPEDGGTGEIGLEDQPMEYQLGRPKGVLTDSTGNIYIADWASQSIKVFGPDGAYIRTQGGRGRGPGEFQGIHMMARTPDHSLFVMDWGGLEYEYLTMDGRQLSSSQADLSSQLTQYYPNQVAWYDTLTIGINRNGAFPADLILPRLKEICFASTPMIFKPK